MSSQKNHSNSFSKNNRISLRLLFASLLIAGVFGTALYFWHGFALRQVAVDLVERARDSRTKAKELLSSAEGMRVSGDAKEALRISESANKEYNKAINHFFQYLQIRPDDVEIRVELAGAFVESPAAAVNPQRAINLLMPAIARSDYETSLPLRVQLISHLNLARDFATAEKEALALLTPQAKAKPLDNESIGKIWNELAISLLFRLEADRQFDAQEKNNQLQGALGIQIPQVISRAIELNPENWRLSFSLANLYRTDKIAGLLSTEQQKQFKELGIDEKRRRLAELADALVGQAIVQNSKISDALVASHFYKLQYGMPQPELDLKAALEVAPNDPLVHFYFGRWHASQVAAPDAAETSGNPLSPEQRDHLVAAASHLDQAKGPTDIGLGAFLVLGDVQYRLGEKEKAVTTWQTALDSSVAKRPDLAIHQRLLVTLLELDRLSDADERLGKWKSSIAEFSRSTQADPRLIVESVAVQDFVQGSIAVKNGDIESAREAFQRVVAADKRTGALAAQANLALGKMYLTLNLPGQAVKFLEKAWDFAPANRQLGHQCARARVLAGQFNLAEADYLRFINNESSPDVWVEYADLLLRIQSQRRASVREWSNLERALSRIDQLSVQRPLAEPWRLAALRIGMKIAKDPASAAEITTPSSTEAESSFYESLGGIVTLIELQAARGDQKEVDRLLDLGLAKTQSLFEQSQLKLNIFLLRQQYPEARALIDKVLPQLESPEQTLLLKQRLIGLDLAEENFDKALAQVEQLSRENPERKDLFSEWIKLAIRLDSIPDASKFLEEGLTKIEGESGQYKTYFDARRVLSQSEKSPVDEKSFENLASAASDINRMLLELPNWSSGHALLGRILDAQLRALDSLPTIPSRNQTTIRNEAVSAFRRAIELGDKSPAILYRLAVLAENFEDSVAILMEIDPEIVTQIPAISVTASEALFQVNDRALGRKIAEEATIQQPTQPSVWLNLALLEIRQGKLAAANEAAEKANALITKQDDLENSLTRLFRFYLVSSSLVGNEGDRQKQLTRAQELIAPIVDATPEKDKVFRLAQLYVPIDANLAGQHFKDAEKIDPENEQKLQDMVRFYSSRNSPAALDDAIRIAEKLTKLDLKFPQDALRYRNQLAQLLSNRGNPDDVDRAIKLIDAIPNSDQDPLDSHRARARLLWRKTAGSKTIRIATLANAVEEITPVVKAPARTADDYILLAEIYREWSEILYDGSTERDEKLELAQLNFDLAAKFEVLNNRQLFRLASFYIERAQWENSDKYTNRLADRVDQERLPDPAPLALRAMMYKRRGDADCTAKVEAMVADFLQKLDRVSFLLNDLQRAQYYVQIATLWDVAGDSAKSIEWFRRAADLNFEMIFPLVAALTNNGQKKAAIQLCAEAYKTKPSQALISQVSTILITGRTEPGEYLAAEPILENVLERYVNDIDVLAAVGNVRVSQPGKLDEAIRLYEQGLKINPNQFVLLNNLATVYGEIPEKRELAIEYVDRALKIKGELPELLHTKATILLYQGSLDSAKKLLLDIVNRNSDPRFWWTFAEVEWQLHNKNPTDARLLKSSHAAWQKALENGIASAILTPSEFERMEKLKQNLQLSNENGSK